MTELEQRLRAELRDVAERVQPVGLRPLTAARAGRKGMAARSAGTRRVRWLRPAAAGLAVALALVVALALAGVILTGRSVTNSVLGQRAVSGQRPAGTRYPPVTGLSAAVDPPVFVTPLHALTLFSSVTGQVIRSLGSVPTGIGFALAPDARELFVTSLVGGHPEILSISVPGGKTSFVTTGSQPAVGPDSRYLTYLPEQGWPSHVLAIRTLASGMTRTIDLGKLMGPGSDLLGSGIAWLGDGRQVVVLPTTMPSSALHPPPVGCGQEDSPRGLCLIVVDTGGSQLRASQVYLPWALVAGLRGTDAAGLMISGLASARRTLLITTVLFGSPFLASVTIDGSQVTDLRRTSLPQLRDAILLAIAPGGDRLLYRTYQSRTRQSQFWMARLQGGRLTGQRLLLESASVIAGRTTW